jgi:hypothetical protein
MNKTFGRSAILILYCLVLYGLFLNAIPLLDPDEPVYGETAKEMLLYHDWLSPRIFGTVWFDKPPMFYWLSAVSLSIFGHAAWAARIPSLLAGTLLSVYLYLSARKFFTEREAWISGFICASSLEVILLSRASVTDMVLTLFITVSLISFLNKNYKTAYIACGLAFLTKGPIGFAFPGIIVLLWMALTHQFRWKNIMSLHWTWGIPLACLIGLPWYLYMGYAYGNDFLNTFLGYHNITRFISPEHAGQNHIWLYIPVLLLGCFPWTGLVVSCVSRIKAWRKDPYLSYFMIWAAFIFLFFSFSSTQLWSYILPVFPPLSLLAAHHLEELGDGRSPHQILFIACELFFTAVPVAGLCFVPFMPDGGTFVKYGFPFFFIVFFFLGMLYWIHGKQKSFLAVMGAFMICFITFTWGAYSEPVSANFASQRINQKAASYVGDHPGKIYVDTFYRPSFAFYTDQYGSALPEFDAAKLEKDKKDNSEGVYLPGQTSQETIEPSSYILVQRKLYDSWPDSIKQKTDLLWSEDTAVFLHFRE